MSRKFRISAILLCVVLVCFICASIGVTAAIWQGDGGDSNTYGPNPISPDWNSWEKYFTYEVGTYSYNGTTVTGAYVTGFSGTNLEDVVFPQSATVGGTIYDVIGIRNTVFSSTTLKVLPVTISISPSVLYIQDSAFANLVNLQSVYFGASTATGARPICHIGEYAFMGCTSLSKSTGIVNAGRTLTYANETNWYLGTLA